MAKSRLIGDYPVIGIRPTIDGRRGVLDVRGSLGSKLWAWRRLPRNCLRKIFAIPMASQ